MEQLPALSSPDKGYSPIRRRSWRDGLAALSTMAAMEACAPTQRPNVEQPTAIALSKERPTTQEERDLQIRVVAFSQEWGGLESSSLIPLIDAVDEDHTSLIEVLEDYREAWTRAREVEARLQNGSPHLREITLRRILTAKQRMESLSREECFGLLTALPSAVESGRLPPRTAEMFLRRLTLPVEDLPATWLTQEQRREQLEARADTFPTFSNQELRLLFAYASAHPDPAVRQMIHESEVQRTGLIPYQFLHNLYETIRQGAFSDEGGAAQEQSAWQQAFHRLLAEGSERTELDRVRATLCLKIPLAITRFQQRYDHQHARRRVEGRTE